MKNKRNLSIIIAFSVLACILLLDLLTKGLIIPNLIPNVGDSINVIPGFINFVYVKNTGAAWGMMEGRPVFLIIISIIVLGLLIAYYILRLKKTGNKSSVLFGLSIGLVAGGCLGNLFDRIAFGYVRDFINFQFMEFPVFNFADVALTAGMIVILIYFAFYYSKEEKLLKNQEKTEKNEEIIAISSNLKEKDDEIASKEDTTNSHEKRGEDNEG